MRDANQDVIAIDEQILTGDLTRPLAVSADPHGCVLLLADGMGGHAEGALASRLVVEFLVASKSRLLDPASCDGVLKEAHQVLFATMDAREEVRGMGSTIVGVAMSPDRLVAFNVGDSRCYLHSSGHLIRLSTDDVPATFQGAFGVRRSHALTQSLGGFWLPLPIDPHVAVEPPLANGETLLLCSDGLSDMVAEDEINDALRANYPLQCVRKLTTRAFQAGARDNYSIIVARYDDRPKPE
ncbi:MAG: serine/threonine-protein phosphatase [Armatimonadetes bacterium]|nr:serine/threonine-protein phosphatase [Armatimonadota bacterium]